MARLEEEAPPQSTDSDTGSRGRLSHVLTIRGEEIDPEAPIRIEHREALIYILGKAAELEHLILCQYLFAAFSLKRDSSEGLGPDVAPLVEHWRTELMDIAEQEMLHLALVQNLLTAVGAGPHLGRPNFPVPPNAYPARVRVDLMPFSEEGLRHFAFLERPEGMEMADADGFAALEKATPPTGLEEHAMGPIAPEFETISHLYRSIEDGLVELSDRLGQEELFVGPPSAQATGGHFRWKELVAVTDLASARRAIGTIVEQGEGARGDWREAHFGRLLAILDQFRAACVADPNFEPARPVLTAVVRPPDSGLGVPLISAPFSVRCVDLLNAVYEVLLQLLSRYFAHTDESEKQLSTLATVAVGLMEEAIGPLGSLATRLPVSADYPDRTVGPTFELFFAVDYLLPHREAAWTLMVERLREVAAFAMRCRDACPVGLMLQLSIITESLRKQADRLAAVA